MPKIRKGLVEDRPMYEVREVLMQIISSKQINEEGTTMELESKVPVAIGNQLFEGRSVLPFKERSWVPCPGMIFMEMDPKELENLY